SPPPCAYLMTPAYRNDHETSVPPPPLRVQPQYRAAHQLHDIKRRLDRGTGIPDIETSMVIASLEELAAWQADDEAEWCGSDSLQWQDAIRELRRRVARSDAVTPGEPAS
ncbi:hypothetical protein AB0N07_21500, partial [Streptomyces sp. NPDC051172]